MNQVAEKNGGMKPKTGFLRCDLYEADGEAALSLRADFKAD